MLTLTLFRHAKSSWATPGLPDFDRPLAPRGEAAVERMAAFLTENDLTPDLILCSSARRTRETLDLALPAFKTRPQIEFDETLYHAVAPVMIGIIRHTPDEIRNLMILGHNPGLQALAIDLVGSGDPELRRAVTRKFPTAAIAVIGFDVPGWAGIKPRGGTLKHFVTPKLLRRQE
ncbi:MAG: histidine phosphatase family protein [Rhodomicrobiaceae bacterium]